MQQLTQYMRLSFFIFTCLFVFCFCDSLFVFYRHFVCLFLSLHDCLFVVSHILPILASRLFVFIVACLFVYLSFVCLLSLTSSPFWPAGQLMMARLPLMKSFWTSTMMNADWGRTIWRFLIEIWFHLIQFDSKQWNFEIELIKCIYFVLWIIFWGGIKKTLKIRLLVNASLHIELLQNIGFRKIPDL